MLKRVLSHDALEQILRCWRDVSLPALPHAHSAFWGMQEFSELRLRQRAQLAGFPDFGRVISS
jgi:hypothetical protein